MGNQIPDALGYPRSQTRQRGGETGEEWAENRKKIRPAGVKRFKIIRRINPVSKKKRTRTNPAKGKVTGKKACWTSSRKW